LGALDGADVLMCDGLIAAVGKRLDVRPDVRVIDVTGKLVLPGFVDLHNHLWQSCIRGAGSDRDLYGWLETCHYPILHKVDAQDVYPFVRLSALDALQAGVTTVVDWVPPVSLETTERYIEALDDSGLRFIYAMMQEVENLDLLHHAKKKLIDPLPLASAQVAVHAMQSETESLRACQDIARDMGVMLNSHVLEHSGERFDDPIAALRSVAAFGPGLLMNHAIHLTDEEIALTADHDVRVAHCPLSNMRLASGIMPLPAMERRGVRVGLGLDGGANDTADMFSLMKSAVGLQRALHQDAGTPPAIDTVLRMATLGGAECVDMADRIGSLTPGKRADVVVLDPAALNFAPRVDWTSQIVLNGQPSNVSYVFVDGSMRKAEGRLVGVDTLDVVRNAEEAAARLRLA
jgi:5-methylthioadenosine/S-adenosylhomocysteine deaminase